MRSLDMQRALADLAAGQWGLVTTPQATALGVTHSQLTRLVDHDLVTRLSHGVYQLRSAASDLHLDLRAAWLALAPRLTAGQRLMTPNQGPVVSHASAAALRAWGDLTAYDSEFTFDGRKQTRRHGVRIHRGSTPTADIDIIDGLPTTTPERLVVDLLRADYEIDHVGSVLAGAIRARSVDLDVLAERAAPYAARHGFGRRAGADLVAALVRSGDAEDEATADGLVRLARRTVGRQSESLPTGVRLPQFDPATFAAIQRAMTDIHVSQLDPATMATLRQAQRILDDPATKRALDAFRQYM